MYDYGYLISGITESENGYEYDGITFTENNNKEKMKEYIGNTEYYYAKINGTKYYYCDVNEKDQSEHGISGGDKKSDNDYIFYINSSGEKVKQVINDKDNKDNKEKFDLYYKGIMENKSAYNYYANAYKFTKRVNEKYNLKDKVKKANIQTDQFIDNDFSDISDIFSSDENYEYSDSAFNVHRQEVIRNVITSNLYTSIAGFNRYSSSGADFIMPKISETDWELLENNVCVATFMQGMSIGGKTYNGYAVVPNTMTKEYVDENDIYILTSDNQYVKANDTTLLDDGSNTIADAGNLGYQPGILKTNFERKKYYATVNGEDREDYYYYPLSYENSKGKLTPYLGSYSSIVGSSSVDSIEYSDMYRYMRDLKSTDTNTNNRIKNLKKTYYTALARERYGAFNVNNSNENNSDANKTSIENWYYLKEYKD